MLRNFVACFLIYLLHHVICTTENISQLSSQVFTFKNPHSFLYMKPKMSLPLSKGLKFKFRTRQPNGILMYHGMKNGTGNLLYGLYLILENAKLRVIQRANTFSIDSFYVGKGLNHDRWHTVSLVAVLSKLHLRVDVDNTYVNTQLSLEKYSSFDDDTDTISFFYFGGADISPISSQFYSYEKFIGCLGYIQFYKISSNSSGTTIKSSHTEKGCKDISFFLILVN